MDAARDLRRPGARPAAWLEGAEINRDRNLRLQYLAGMGLNDNQGGRHLPGDMLLHRTFPDALFTGSPAEGGSGARCRGVGVRLRPDRRGGVTLHAGPDALAVAAHGARPAHAPDPGGDRLRAGRCANTKRIAGCCAVRRRGADAGRQPRFARLHVHRGHRRRAGRGGGPGADGHGGTAAPSRRASSRNCGSTAQWHRIEPPATIEGGDVLRVGRTLLVGLSSRTSRAG